MVQRRGDFLRFIEDYSDNYPKEMTTAQIFDATMDGVHVKALVIPTPYDEPEVFFNVYVPPPTRDVVGHQLWLLLFREAKFPTTRGTGFQKVWDACEYCCAQDHPTSVCSGMRFS